jgi:hypothetical protein
VRRRSHAVAPLLRLSVLVPLALLLGGCAVFGLVGQAIPETVHARYDGLGGETVAVMVWADDGVLMDFPNLRLDIAKGIQTRLQGAQEEGKQELVGTQWVSPASVVRFQEEHPELDFEPAERVAPRMAGVTRLIFVEVKDFQTRADESVDLFRGSLTARVRVIEVDRGRQPPGTRLGFEEAEVRTVFPESGHDEGTPNFGDARMYRETLLSFTEEVAGYFFTFTRERPFAEDRG